MTTTIDIAAVEEIMTIVEADLDMWGYLDTDLSDYATDDVDEAVAELISLGIAVRYNGEVMAPDYRDDIVAEAEEYIDAIDSAWYARWN